MRLREFAASEELDSGNEVAIEHGEFAEVDDVIGVTGDEVDTDVVIDGEGF